MVEKTQNTFEECLTRMPYIVKPPAGTAVQPGVRDGLVELLDLVATVEELAGLKRDYTYFGPMLLPHISGDTDSHKDDGWDDCGTGITWLVISLSYYEQESGEN